MSLEVNTIHVHGHSFTYAKIRGFEILMMEDGRINLKSLCQQCGTREWKQIIRGTNFQDLVVAVEKSKVGADGMWKCEYSTGVRIHTPVEIKELRYDIIAREIFHIEGGGDSRTKAAKVAGTYGPRYLIDYLIMIEDPKYLITVHELLEAVDSLSITSNATFTETLKETIIALEERNKELENKVAIKDRVNTSLLQHLHNCSEKKTQLKDKLLKSKEKKSRLEMKIDTLIEINNNQTQQLQEANVKLTDMNKDLKEANENIKQLQSTIENGKVEVVKSIDNVKRKIIHKINNTNLTTATTKEHLILYKIQQLTSELRYSERISEDEVALDVFRGQLKNEKSTMLHRKYKFNTATDKRYNIGLTANAVDIFNYIKSKGFRILHDKNKIYTIVCKRELVTVLIHEMKSFIAKPINEFKKDVNSNFGIIKDNLYDKLEIIEADNDATIAAIHAEVVPDPTNEDEENINMNKEYYYRKHYRNINKDERGYYFIIGSGQSRVREYVLVNDLLSLRTR